jgi:2-methylaconitate cis-trans-isomerase PrpF
MPTDDFLPDFWPRIRFGIPEFPVHHMRGGTSTGLVIAQPCLPPSLELREELLRHLMGVPHTGHLPGNRQITGLGRASATSNKVFIAAMDGGIRGAPLVSTLAQLASDHGVIDWSVNCGNMSSALPLWALDMGLLRMANDDGAIELEIHNTNTGVDTLARMVVRDGQLLTARIPGVDGRYPQVDLFLQNPVGAKTGQLLPTGNAQDDIAGHRVSCVDVAVPMVIADAAEFGKTAHEPAAQLQQDSAFMQALRKVWIAAGLKMRLRRKDGVLMSEPELAASETIPKVCIVGAPGAGGHIAVRYFTPQTAHASLAVSGGCCLASATLIPGTIAHRLARHTASLTDQFSEVLVSIENPAGLLDATITARMDGAMPQIRSAAYRRSAQILLRGFVPLYQCSSALAHSLAQQARQSGRMTGRDA